MPFGTQKKREQLTGSKLAELQAKLGDLKVLICDEINMVANEMWIDMDQRLQSVRQSSYYHNFISIIYGC